MNNERYKQIVDEAYIDYAITCIKRTKEQEKIMKEKGGWLSLCLTPYFESKEEFITKCKTDSEFAERWGLKIEERDLTLEERYNKWFNNNYETGMERFFNPNDPPDFDNTYYEPTPTKLITVTYQENKTEIYE